MTLTWRAITADDVPGLTRLINAAVAADDSGRPLSEAAVAEQLDAPRFDPQRDTVAAELDGSLVAAGSVWSGSEPLDGWAMVAISGDVHPQHRGRGIGRELLTRLETRGLELSEERFPGLPTRLRSAGGTAASSTEQLLQLAGYRPDNYFITMEVELDSWVGPDIASGGVAPDAITISATRDAHNDAFRDHRNFTPATEEVWAHWMSGEENRGDLSRLALVGDRVVAYALVSEPQPGVAHVEIVGTRREARGQGLARAVLVGALRAARDAGLAVAELEVDSTSPTGADRLYSSVGFAPVRTISRYVREVA